MYNDLEFCLYPFLKPNKVGEVERSANYHRQLNLWIGCSYSKTFKTNTHSYFIMHTVETGDINF